MKTTLDWPKTKRSGQQQSGGAFFCLFEHVEQHTPSAEGVRRVDWTAEVLERVKPSLAYKTFPLNKPHGHTGGGACHHTGAMQGVALLLRAAQRSIRTPRWRTCPRSGACKARACHRQVSSAAGPPAAACRRRPCLTSSPGQGTLQCMPPPPGPHTGCLGGRGGVPRCIAAAASLGTGPAEPCKRGRGGVRSCTAAPARLDRPQLHVEHLVLLGGEEGGGAHGGAQLGGHHDAPLAAGLHALNAQLKACRGGATTRRVEAAQHGRPPSPTPHLPPFTSGPIEWEAQEAPASPLAAARPPTPPPPTHHHQPPHAHPV